MEIVIAVAQLVTVLCLAAGIGFLSCSLERLAGIVRKLGERVDILERELGEEEPNVDAEGK